eukprot:g2450.t1
MSCEYERARNKQIALNKQKLIAMGLDKSAETVKKLAMKKRQQSKRKKTTRTIIPPGERRRSSRKRKKVNYSEQAGDNPQDDDDYEVSETTSDYESSADDQNENENHFTPVSYPKSIRKPNSAKTSKNSILTIEHAKSGRSTCRKCMVKIQKGEWRVGMESWIMGRQAVTWQHPSCFLKNLILSRCSTGRSKCKATGGTFQKNEMRLGFRSHRNTNFVKMSVVKNYLMPVFQALDDNKELVRTKDIEGADEMNNDEKNALEMIFDSCMKDAKTNLKVKVEREEDDKQVSISKTQRKSSVPTTSKNTMDRKKEQPPLGKKTQSSGRVAWKFAGKLCYGELLPKKESKTHCYARTHKGNIKTLSKGKAYWWIIG